MNKSRFGGGLRRLAAAVPGLAVFLGLTSVSAPAGPLSPASLAGDSHKKVSSERRLLRQVAVFGKDQRRRLPRKYRRLGDQVGLLHNPKTNTLCTAFCVGPDTIATASHCLFSHHKHKKLFLSDFVFKLNPGGNGKSRYARLAGHRNNQSRRYIVTGTSKLNRKPPIGAAKDWALARLERSACADGWLRTRKLSQRALERASRRKRLFQVAFHMDYGDWDIAYSRACAVNRNYGKLAWSNIRKHFSSPNSLILHRCDTGEASSGSPLLMDSGDGPVVIGINVGTYQQRDITVKNGRIIHRSNFRTIANTAVSSDAFDKNISLLSSAKILTGMPEMKQLQLNLRERGYYHGVIDGIYGSRTEFAVKALERGMKLPVTGLATLAILDRLNNTGSDAAATIGTSAGSRNEPEPDDQKPAR